MPLKDEDTFPGIFFLSFHLMESCHMFLPKLIRGNQDSLKPIKSHPSLNHIDKWDRMIPKSNKILLGCREEKCMLDKQPIVILNYPRA